MSGGFLQYQILGEPALQHLSAGSLTRDTLQFDMDTDVDVMSMTNAREKQTSR